MQRRDLHIHLRGTFTITMVPGAEVPYVAQVETDLSPGVIREAGGRTPGEALMDALTLTPQQGTVAERLEYLRGELRAERISYAELAELQGLAAHIDPGDTELLEAAGVPEHPKD